MCFLKKKIRDRFWTLLRGAGVSAPELYNGVMELARAKLVASRDIDGPLDKVSDTRRMAVLDVQLSLDYEPRREKVRIEEAALVESHMRIVYSVPADREYLRSGYPSEPLLAEAAARQLWTWRTQDPFVAVDTLTDILKTGLLDRGELGELTGRQLLLDAYHRAVESEQSSHLDKMPPNFSAGCRFLTFMEMLISEQYVEMVLNSVPDNVGGVSFREAFKDAKICFTHFGKMADATGVTSTAAWVAFVRHMAIMARNGQDNLDCILPVLLWDTKLCEHVVTGVLIQFRRRKQKSTIAKSIINEADIDFFPKAKASRKCTHGPVEHTYSYRPYVCLVMEMGVQVKPHGGAKKSTKIGSGGESYTRPQTPPPMGQRSQPTTPSRIEIPSYGQKHHTTKGHARYSIFIYGCSPTVYRGIDDAHKATYAHLLNSRDFFAEHPRQDLQTLAAVRKMKPVWSGGKDCYHWVERDEILHADEVDLPEEECVLVQVGMN